MYPRTTSTTTAVLAAALLVAGLGFSARAEDAPATPATAASPAAAAAAPARDPNAVVAKVGDENVTEREVALAHDAFANELTSIPEPQRRSVLIDAVVNMKLMAKAARDQGFGEGADFDAQVQFLTLQALRNAYIARTITDSLTPEELQKGYQDLVVANFKPAPQVRARHILVDTKEAAEKIIADLKGGKSFEELAKQSKDPSGQNGGDLGFFGEGQMVPEFEKAAFALEPGQITETPVQSQFGWHVIKVEEKRMSTPPALADVQEQLKTYLLRQKFDATLAALREKYPVEIVDQSAAPAAAPAPAPAPAPTPAPAQ